MTVANQKFKYFLSSLIKAAQFKDLACPSCGCHDYDDIDKKYMVTRLVRCVNCQLLYRVPTTTEKEYSKYYQDDYSEGFTTDLPALADLDKMKRLKFAGMEKDYSKYIEVLRALGCGDKLLDFGCSWGYGSWQFSQAGFDVKAFELSQKRREFANRHLGVNVYSDASDIDDKFDIFFSAHVLEHIPKVSGIIGLARKVVKPGGWFVAFTPNGSFDYRNTNPRGWHSSWGFVHPLLIDDAFYRSVFRDSRYMIGSSPYNTPDISDWADTIGESKVFRLDGSELLVAVRF